MTLLGAALGARAADNPLPAIHANHWPEAQAMAQSYADPVAEKLVTYYRLLTPGAATAYEIAAFVASNPDWPNQAILERRRQEAIATEIDPALALTECRGGKLTLPAALARCAAAEADAGNSEAAASDAKAAWQTGLGDPSAQPFLKRFGALLTPADELARFDHLAWTDPAAASTEIPRLPASHRAAAKIRLALAHGAPDALTQVQSLAAAECCSPGLVLEEARALRRTNRIGDALALWRSQGLDAETADTGHRAAFWLERSILARELLKTGEAEAAYEMADDRLQPASSDAGDAAFLAGFIALRRLNDPARAEAQFKRLAGLSKAAITQARALYWLGRADEAAGRDPHLKYQAASAWPTTFYGQLAAAALGKDPASLVKAARDPGFTDGLAWRFTGHELVRAAITLVAWGEPGRARSFLVRMAEVAPDQVTQELCARLALALGMPDTAVFVARRVGLDGRMLPDSGWPMPVDPPPGQVDPAVILALIRQESSFDHGVISPAGARGLMQVMPATARQISSDSAIAGLLDPEQNMRLGENYMGSLLDRFGGCLPLAVAAYNAGPRKVGDWLAENADPRTGNVPMLDWIELITFGETRNYVQRVLENAVIYAAKRDEPDQKLIAQWAPARPFGHDG